MVFHISVDNERRIISVNGIRTQTTWEHPSAELLKITNGIDIQTDIRAVIRKRLIKEFRIPEQHTEKLMWDLVTKVKIVYI